MITLLLWMTSIMVTVMTISPQKETIDEITRDYNGDIFTIISNDCQKTSCDRNGRYAASITGNDCRCQCSPSHQVFREDVNQCVKDLIECPLAAFIRPFLTERIPVVSLPVSSGQLIHPGAHLTISGLANLMNTSAHIMCNIDSSEIMTFDGWQSISDRSQLFELYEDGNNTFLQWIGADSVRKYLHQKLVLIRLNCPTSSGTYMPCISIRIGWVPGISVIGSDFETFSIVSYGNTKDIHQQSNNYLIIGLCLGLLGMMYVLALMIYIRTKKVQLIKQRHRNLMFGNSNQTQIDSLNRIESGNANNDFNASLTDQSYQIDNNIVSKTECQLITELSSDKSTNNENKNKDMYDESNSFRSEQNPIPKGFTSERALKRCLHINPEYFEPELLKLPPPPAIEFLQRIRELISNARLRIKNFRFRPTLLVIPEDDYFYSDVNKTSENKCESTIECNDLRGNIVIPSQSQCRQKHTQTPIFSRKDFLISNSQLNSKNISTICEKDFNTADNIDDLNLNQEFKENKINGQSSENTVLDDCNDYCKTKFICDNNHSLNQLEYTNEESKSTDLLSKISRKDMLMKIKDIKTNNFSDSKYKRETIDESKIIDESNIICESSTKSMPPNEYLNCIEDDVPLDSLKLLSAKVAKKLSESNVPDLNIGDHNSENSELKKFQHLVKDFRNSFGKLNGKRKSCLSNVKDSDNWTLQSVNMRKKKINSSALETDSTCTTTSDNYTSGEDSLALNKEDQKKSTKYKIKDSKSCNCNNLEIRDTKNICDNSSHSKYDQNVSLDSIETNFGLNSLSTTGYECDVGTTDSGSTSSDEISTTSSFKENHFNSIESISIKSDITEDSLNTEDNFSDDTSEECKRLKKKAHYCESESSVDFIDFQTDDDDDNPIEACLMQLANTPLDCNDDSKCNLKVDRATKGMTALHHIKSSHWKHICIDNNLLKGQHLNGYFSDEAVSSVTPKKLSLYHTNDNTIYQNNIDKIKHQKHKMPLNSSINNENRCSCRMSSYETHECKDNNKSYTSTNFVKTKAKNTSKTCNHNNFLKNKLMTCHPKKLTKLTVYKGSASDDEISRQKVLFKKDKLDESSDLVGNGHVSLDDMSDDSNSSFFHRNFRSKRISNGTCKQYIQQRQKICDNDNYQRCVTASPLFKKHLCNASKSTMNDELRAKIDHQNDSSKATVIEVNENPSTHFVTRIPV